MNGKRREKARYGTKWVNILANMRFAEKRSYTRLEGKGNKRVTGEREKVKTQVKAHKEINVIAASDWGW